MDPQYAMSLVFRWLHVLAAMTAVGGAIFARFVVLPAVEGLPADGRDAVHAAMRARWSKIVAAAIAFLLVSGLYNFAMIVVQYELPRWYHPIFGVKFLAAFGVFAIASALAGKTPAAEAMRRNTKQWLNLNIVLAVIIVCLSGVLRSADKTPKPEPTAEPPTAGRAA